MRIERKRTRKTCLSDYKIENVSSKIEGQEINRGDLTSLTKVFNESDPILTKVGTRFDELSLIFDPEWYKDVYRDVAATEFDPVTHYFKYGYREGRNPNKHFDTNWYASRHIEVAATGLNPFLYYILYGAREGHRPAPS